MKEIGPPPRRYRLQGFLRINSQIYEKNYGFPVDFRNHNRLSIFLFHVSLSLAKAMQSAQARLKREVILDQILSAQSCWTGEKEESEFVSKHRRFLHLGRADLWERSLSN